MKILVTGAAGFLGSRLAGALLAGAPGLPKVSTLVAVDTAACRDRRSSRRLQNRDDHRRPASRASIVDTDVDVVYHLAAIVSGQAEAEFDLGMRVNVDATRALLEACRRLEKPPRFIFTSTLAVFGGPLPAVVPDDAAVVPQSSYGSEKAIAELLVHEYSRKGFVDGIVCRLPTVAVRPGAPNAAASSFVSGIVREPLAGIDTVCPVPLDTRLWISLTGGGDGQSRACRARSDVGSGGPAHREPSRVDASRRRRCWPASSGWPAPRYERVFVVRSINASRSIVCTWPGAFDVSRALRLGFSVDRDIDAIVRQFMAERLR